MKKKLFALLAVLGICVMPAVLSCQKTSGPDDNGETPVNPPDGGTDPESSGDLSWPMDKQLDVDVQHYIVPDAPFEYDIEYEYDPTNFPNPERGPYYPISYDYHGGAVPALKDVSSMVKAREGGCSLMFSQFYLRDFLDGPISEAALEHMDKHFDRVREAGCKSIVRYCYSWYWNKNDITQQEPDADIILAQIQQVKPILQKHADVIYVVQMGFVGTYGEWAYTTNVKTSTERSMIVKAVLDALPPSRQVALRTPNHMRNTLRYLYNVDSVPLKDTLTAQEAFSGTYKARLACFNDCAFVNATDGGTVSNAEDQVMWAKISNYVAYGGESCFQGETSDFCGYCQPAYNRLRAYHWSYLSNHHDIIPIWKREGCYDDASCRVGYRYVLNGVTFKGDFAAAEDFEIKLCLGNYGFASLINAHVLEFVVAAHDNPSEKYVFRSDFDPRLWKGNRYYTHTERIVLPEALVQGRKYDLFINIADAEDSLYGRPEYSIRFANKNVWDASTGYNLLSTFIAR